ncbi:sulfite exporter TauE/SafE family protein [Maribacter sp. HTCC2170]|uniref:sulfite exporter TauE/SafE family protein n=1 Tax=Maribacter sp. (strain HTCC2170 / KCCM 42371) TaxID=313603 RepID=UPI00006B49C6|nr:sulfite exporter TauE/SafE family protein [Maribacter sp. HTCC2170]EAR00972.1 possible transmembrane protein [Maribacter sp. HTCC2170]
MLINIESLLLLCAGFFVIAVLYSAVGMGGGSSYLALLTLFVASFFAIRSIALVCNLIVVSGSTILYFKHGHARLKDFVPFIITSIPMAFLGASFRLKEEVFFIVLGASLIISSLFLVWQTSGAKWSEPTKEYPRYLSYVIGASIGFLSGLVGIGGGIFLAPILNHINWDKSVKIAALASFFILVNSISGIGGLLYSDTFELPWMETLILGVTVLVGGQLGIRLSLKKLSAKSIKRITAVLVFVVGVRVLLVNGLGLI